MPQLPFLEPAYEPVPEVPDAAHEELLPIFFPPEELQVRHVGAGDTHGCR